MVNLSLSLDINSFKLSEFKPIEKRRIHINKHYYFDKKKNKILQYEPYDCERMSKAFSRSLSISRKKIEKIAELNEFTHFITITFNKEYVNRSSAEEVSKTFKNIVKRFKYHYGNDIAYLQVGEFHEDLKNIHYHCFFRFNHGAQPKLIYKGLTSKGQCLYTIRDNFKRKDCFITVEKINKCSPPTHYLTKYLTKSNIFPFRRKFGSSIGLIRDTTLDKISLTLSDYDYYKIIDLLPQETIVYGKKEEYRRVEVESVCGTQTDLTYDSLKDENHIVKLQKLYYMIKEFALEVGRPYENVKFDNALETFPSEEALPF